MTSLLKIWDSSNDRYSTNDLVWTGKKKFLIITNSLKSVRVTMSIFDLSRILAQFNKTIVSSWNIYHILDIGATKFNQYLSNKPFISDFKIDFYRRCSLIVIYGIDLNPKITAIPVIINCIYWPVLSSLLYCQKYFPCNKIRSIQNNFTQEIVHPTKNREFKLRIW